MSSSKVSISEAIKSEPLRGVASMRAGPVFYPPLTGTRRSWFALYVQVNHEKEVTRILQQKHLEPFLPLHECWSKRKDRRKKLSLPLFPGYLFVNTVLDNHTHVEILKVPGALKIIGNSEGPIPIPDFQIESLRTVIESPVPFSLYNKMREGDWVQVVRGPLTGCIGTLVRQNFSKGRLVISIDIVCKAVSVELDIEDVEPIEPPQVQIAC